MNGDFDLRTGLWVETIENPTNYQLFLIAELMEEIPSVDVIVGLGKSVWLRGSQANVKWFLHLLDKSVQETEHAWDPA
jgi:hypothetical protein